MDRQDFVKWLSELQAIAQNGLAFTKDPYDQLRFEALRILCAEMSSKLSDFNAEKIHDLFAAEYGYATPKIDVRGVVFQQEKILLVQEAADGLWTLPGGWADVNQSAAESVAREIAEESGYIVKVTKLLGLYDKLKHDHPHQWPHAYKAFFLCELIGGDAKTSIETLAVRFFAKEEIPPLSTPRVTHAQIMHMFEHRIHPEWDTEFD